MSITVKEFGPPAQAFKPLRMINSKRYPAQPVVSVEPEQKMVVIDNLPKQEKAKLWAVINKQNPDLATLMKEPFLLQLKHTFNASNLMPLAEYKKLTGE